MSHPKNLVGYIFIVEGKVGMGDGVTLCLEESEVVMFGLILREVYQGEQSECGES